MLREAAIMLALATAIISIAPSAPALPLDCGPALTLEESAQNDADSGDDAADTSAGAYRIVYDDYYWGYLSRVDHGRADLEDWYVFSVPAGKLSLMANVIVSAPLVPNEQYLPDSAQRYYLTVRAPDGETRSTTSAGGSARFELPLAGDYLLRITAEALPASDACAGTGSDAGTPGTPIARNHGLYVGCNPVCAEKVVT